jgi:K+-transporting ATPase ATPase A chain
VPNVAEALSFNTAISFTTNTNWQNYAPESTVSHLTQMAGLAVQNFVSAAVGIAVAIALVRGLTRRQAATTGNFWWTSPGHAFASSCQSHSCPPLCSPAKG